MHLRRVKKKSCDAKKALPCGIKGAIKRRAFWFILYLHFPFTAHIFIFFIHSYTAQNDSSFNDGATGDALQEPPEAFTCMRIFFFFLSYILYFLRDKFLQSRVLIMCTCNFKHTTSFFYLILAHTREWRLSHLWRCSVCVLYIF